MWLDASEKGFRRFKIRSLRNESSGDFTRADFWGFKKRLPACFKQESRQRRSSCGGESLLCFSHSTAGSARLLVSLKCLVREKKIIKIKKSAHQHFKTCSRARRQCQRSVGPDAAPRVEKRTVLIVTPRHPTPPPRTLRWTYPLPTDNTLWYVSNKSTKELNCCKCYVGVYLFYIYMYIYYYSSKRNLVYLYKVRTIRHSYSVMHTVVDYYVAKGYY